MSFAILMMLPDANDHPASLVFPKIYNFDSAIIFSVPGDTRHIIGDCCPKIILTTSKWKAVKDRTLQKMKHGIFPHVSHGYIHLFQKTLPERTANGSCRTEIARPKGTVVSIFDIQKPHKSAYLTIKNSIFARPFFIFWHFEDVLVLSMTWNDLFCCCVDDVSICMTNVQFCLVPSAGSNSISR